MVLRCVIREPPWTVRVISECKKEPGLTSWSSTRRGKNHPPNIWGVVWPLRARFCRHIPRQNPNENVFPCAPVSSLRMLLWVSCCRLKLTDTNASSPRWSVSLGAWGSPSGLSYRLKSLSAGVCKMVWVLAGQTYLNTCWAVRSWTTSAAAVSAHPCSYRRWIILGVVALWSFSRILV